MGYINSPFVAGALLTNRDGIVGAWKGAQPRNAPTKPSPYPLEDLDHLERWEPWVLMRLLDFEITSRLGFSQEIANQPADRKTMSLWHLETTPTTGTDAPTVEYHPLCSMRRPGISCFRKQLDFIEYYADLRPDRSAEVVAQLDTTAAFLSSVAYLHPDRSRWTLELLGAAYRMASHVEMRFKHALCCRRPIELSAQVQPIILTPSHGSLPSGHSTESFTLATVLLHLMKAGSNEAYDSDTYGVQLMRLAARIAINRTVAGVHFPVDSIAGAVLGMTLGEYLVAIASRAANFRGYGFDGEKLTGTEDFVPSTLINFNANPPVLIPEPTNAFLDDLGTTAITGTNQSAILNWLWGKAVAEWN